ncbi:YheC/YheD family protein [Alteribacillus sp. JSM 102045]|uniref:YheC/YheD family protein n=1 Tax=Alteribacillus sp. JSM 102045 TaxID=1562101 RepID=UPI0035BEBBF0
MLDVDENKHSGGEEPLAIPKITNVEYAKKLAMNKDKTKKKDYFGVLVSPKTMRALSEQRPHFRTKTLIKMNKDVGFNMFLFSINTIDIQNQLITGIYYDYSDGKWKKDIFPYPDFFYRRGGVAKKYKKRYKTFQYQLKKKKSSLLNPSPLGNWDVYNYFNKVISLEKHLQKSILYKDPDTLFDMLEKHRHIYLKGLIGRKGKNVVLLEQLPDNRYQFRYYNASQKKIQTVTFKKKEDTLKFINKFYKGKKFMIQEAIDLLKLNKRRIDLRAELQRTPYGTISICGISARLGKEKSPVTTHSDAMTLDELFKFLKLSETEQSKLYIKMENFLNKVYRETENKFGKFAEMGIDFALDQDYNIRFIECNSQSAKVSLHKAYGSKALEKSMLNVLLYAKSLSKRKATKKK